MNADYYSGHKFEWTRKFMNAIPRDKGLNLSKALCIAAVLQHKYILGKKREVKLDHKTLREFSLNNKNLEKYLPFFEKAELIKWDRKRGAVYEISLLSLPPNYIVTSTETNRIKDIKIKETSETGSKVTSETGSKVTSETGSKVENMKNGKGNGRKKGRNERKKGRNERKEWLKEKNKEMKRKQDETRKMVKRDRKIATLFATL